MTAFVYPYRPTIWHNLVISVSKWSLWRLVTETLFKKKIISKLVETLKYLWRWPCGNGHREGFDVRMPSYQYRNSHCGIIKILRRCNLQYRIDIESGAVIFPMYPWQWSGHSDAFWCFHVGSPFLSAGVINWNEVPYTGFCSDATYVMCCIHTKSSHWLCTPRIC